MANYLLRDRMRDLWLQINDLHLSYLQEDESPRKIEERKKLEWAIREYLCVAPHERKFYCRETSQVLHRSVETKQDFSAFRATTAWAAIAAYAHNLIAQPWRKEFHEIKMYSGYYKHQVESNLIGGELMLGAIGYRQTGRALMRLEGPVDPDRVANVSRDSLVALVECQIMRSVYSEVVKSTPHLTWLEVLVFRESHVCTPEQAVKGLLYKLQQQRYQQQLYSHHTIEACPYQPPARYYSCGGYTLPSQPQPRYGALVSPPHSALPTHYPIVNGYHHYTSTHHNGFIPVAPPHYTSNNYSCSVPTGQLIELDPPLQSGQTCTHRRSSSDHHAESRSISASEEIKRKHKDSWDSWGYVYQELDERDKNRDTVTTHAVSRRSPSPTDLEAALKVFSLEDLDISLPERQNGQGDKKRGRAKEKCGEDLVDTHKLHVRLNDKWECTTCTFHNAGTREVCEMCGKSRTLGSETKPLASGGRQCPQCTLVNEKGVTTCEACGSNLKDSPTYI